MTAYHTGFISSIIHRSDLVLKRNQYDVTRLLMLLSVGYAMVWERLKYHSSDAEQEISDIATNSKLEKKLGQSTCENTLNLESNEYFKRFSEDQRWVIYEVPGYNRRYSIDELSYRLNDSQKLDRSELKYSRLFSCLRNSLAHGGVHPLSPVESNRFLNLFMSTEFLKVSSEEIHLIVFVSKKTDNENNPTGFRVLVMSVNAAHNFWLDWRSLLIKGQYINYTELDNAA